MFGHGGSLLTPPYFMSNYYTKFSFVMSLPSAQAVADALFIAETLEAANLEGKIHPEAIDRIPAALREPDVIESWPYEIAEADGSPDGLGIWFHGEDGGIDCVCLLVQHLLAKYQPAEHVEFEWSNDASKPLLDAFGGGSAFITATGYETTNTAQWLDAKRKVWDESKKPKCSFAGCSATPTPESEHGMCAYHLDSVSEDAP